ncbi:MAG: transposase [Erysipelothrix sp.]|nr:transposase [Erysipelothrix sp.]
MNNFNDEFKKMIVEMYEGGEPVSKLSDEYNVSRPTIYNWIKLYKTIEISDDETTDLNEVMKIKREMAKLKEENEVLKKCITIFSKKQ